MGLPTSWSLLLLAGCGGVESLADASAADATDAVEDATLGFVDVEPLGDACAKQPTCPPDALEGAPCSWSGWMCEYPSDGGCPRLFVCGGGNFHENPCFAPPTQCAEGSFCLFGAFDDVRCEGDAGECVCIGTSFRCTDAGSPKCPAIRPLAGEPCTGEGARCNYTGSCSFHECRCGTWVLLRAPYPCGK